MSFQRFTVGTMVAEVRRQLDEDNRAALTDEDDIIPALNRAQNYAADVIARQYPAMLLTNTSVPVIGHQDTFDIPEDAFEQRIMRLEVDVNGTFYPMQYVDYADLSVHEITSQTVAVPYYWTTIGNRYKIVPKSSGAFALRLWYLKDPLPLVPEQGRINSINLPGNYLILDSLGSDLSTTADDLQSFVNVIDGRSGNLKATLQIQALDTVTKKITFRASPTRTTVLDLPVGTTLTGLDPAVDVDDYVCLVPGTSVSFLKSPLVNFLVQYAVSELTRKFFGSRSDSGPGGDVSVEQAVLDKFEAQVEHTWVRRPNNLRVKKRNPYWLSKQLTR